MLEEKSLFYYTANLIYPFKIVENQFSGGNGSWLFIFLNWASNGKYEYWIVDGHFDGLMHVEYIFAYCDTLLLSAYPFSYNLYIVDDFAE